MKHALREQAIKLRSEGWSYNIIADRLSVSKSTLSCWLRDVPFKPNATVKKRMNDGLAKSVATRHKKKLQSIKDARDKARQDVGALSKRDLAMLGIALYMGEGMKLSENTRFINSDPALVALCMRWFREILHIPEKHFHINLHIYPDLSEKSAQRYWSKITGIPLKQFGKTQVDLRENKSRIRKRKLPYGTAHVSVRACGKSEFGVHLHRYIMGCIEAIYKQAGVV